MLITGRSEEKGNVVMEVARQIKGKVEEHTNLGSVRRFPLAAKPRFVCHAGPCAHVRINKTDARDIEKKIPLNTVHENNASSTSQGVLAVELTFHYAFETARWVGRSVGSVGGVGKFGEISTWRGLFVLR